MKPPEFPMDWLPCMPQINLGHSLNLKVVAEVDAEEQSRLLRLLECDEMQGFLFSKPLPCENFEASFLASPVTG